MGLGFQRVVVVAVVMLLWISVSQAQQVSKPETRSPFRPSSHAFPVPPDAGSVSDGVYSNTFFGFSYKLPYGWVERTDAMRDDSSSSAGPSKSQVLLAVFERPPEASGDTPNSAVIIAAESVSAYPGLKSAADYFSPLTEVTTAGGFKVVEGPYEFLAGGRTLVRGDFSKEALSKEAKTPAMHQSSLVMLAKGYVVSFTFIGADEDDVAELIEGLNFGAGRKSAKPAAGPKK